MLLFVCKANMQQGGVGFSLSFKGPYGKVYMNFIAGFQFQ